ncbi:MAG: DUF368 domain-containing protein [Myxococcota bacterium]
MSEEKDDEALAVVGIRAAIGGVLMGLANLVPGISGGTMLLASGVYPRFIRAISELSTLKFRKRSIFVIGVVAVCALAAIVLLAGTVKGLVVSHRWVMYSLFIGLTLGGVPLVWRMAQPVDRRVWTGFVVGVVPMAVLAYYQMFTPQAGGDNESWMMLFFAGVAGASAMILPGVSGGYLLLVMGVYVPVLGGIDAFKEALKARSWDLMQAPLFDVVVPVGLGVAIGVLVVSNVLEKLLKKAPQVTLGGLLGLLVGAVAGLWPFRVGVAPSVGDVWPKTGEVITAQFLQDLPADKYPTEFFAPSVGQMAGAVGLVVAGFAVTAVIARFGGSEKKEAAKAETLAAE